MYNYIFKIFAKNFFLTNVCKKYRACVQTYLSLLRSSVPEISNIFTGDLSYTEIMHLNMCDVHHIYILLERHFIAKWSKKM